MESLEKLTTLEILLLSFVKNGLGTAYDLMTQAGMSVGLSGQALQRLEKLHSVSATAGPRNRKFYTLTKKGEKELRAALTPDKSRTSWFARFGVFDSAPRAMFLAWLYSEQGNGGDQLHWSIDELRHRSLEKGREAETQLRDIHRLRSAVPEGDPLDLGPLIAKAYWWMKAVSDAALLKAQVEVLEQVGPLLSRLPPVTSHRDKFLEDIEAIAGDQGFHMDMATLPPRKLSRARE